MASNGLITLPTGIDLEDIAAVEAAIKYIPQSALPGPFCDIQSRTVETNSRTCYDRRMFRGSSTNPKVVVWHPDEWGFDDSKPTRLFLQLIDKEIVNNPDALIPADEAQIKRLKQLLKDVEV